MAVGSAARQQTGMVIYLLSKRVYHVIRARIKSVEMVLILCLSMPWKNLDAVLLSQSSTSGVCDHIRRRTRPHLFKVYFACTGRKHARHNVGTEAKILPVCAYTHHISEFLL